MDTGFVIQGLVLSNRLRSVSAYEPGMVLRVPLFVSHFLGE